MLVQRYESEDACHRLFPDFFIHFLYKNVHSDLHTGIPDGFDAPNKFDNGTGGDRMGKINTIRRDGDAPKPGKARGGDERHFIHHRECRPPEKRVVMVGIIRKNSFKNAGFRSEDLFF